jgi:hypothetical protein
MRLAQIVVAAVAAGLAGCAFTVPGKGDKKVPLTPPSAQYRMPTAAEAARAASAPASAPSTRPSGSTVAQEARRMSISAKFDQARSARTKAAARGTTTTAAASRPTRGEGKLEILGSPVVVAGAVVQVNNHFISVDEILRAASLELSQLPTNISEEAFRARAQKIITEETRRQVSHSLAMPEAEKALSDEQKKMIDKEMDETLQDMISTAGGSKKQLEQNLLLQGTTLQAVLDNQRRRLTVHWFLRMKFAPTIAINRATLWDYYTRHRQDYASPPKVQMQIVSVPFKAYLPEGVEKPIAAEMEAARDQARRRIAQAIKTLHVGEDFGQVAEEYSAGGKSPPKGLWPPMPAGSFKEEAVEKAAFAQESGQVSEVIETDSGCYVVKTCQVLAGASVSFEDAQADIEKTLRDQQGFKRYNGYYEGLMQKATIVQAENFLPQALNRAVDRYWGK